MVFLFFILKLLQKTNKQKKGITTDDPTIESVVSMEVINSDGVKLTCSKTENKELFSLVIGGYGLYGIISQITLRIVPNVKISMETIKLTYEQFPKFYQNVLKSD